MPYPLAPPLDLPQQQMRNRIAMQMIGRPGTLGAPGTMAPRPAVMPPQLLAPNPAVQAMQQQQQQAAQLQQQRALSEIFSPRVV